MPVDVRGIDEREFGSEGEADSFYVAFFERPYARTEDGYEVAYSHDGYRLSGCSVSQALAWAQEHAPEKALWSVGLVSVRPSGDLSLTWLEGGDPNDAQGGQEGSTTVRW